MWYLRRVRWWLQNRWYRLKSTAKRWWRGLGAGAALYKVLGAAKVLGLAKFGKMAWMLVSMLLFAGSMALIYGWAFGFGLLGILLVHEMGHAVAAGLVGIPVSLPMFIPFFGGYVALRKMPKNAVQEAFIAAGGPIGGLLATLACLAVYQMTDRPLFLVLTIFGAYIHLFNLMPIYPWDGGRMVAPISRWLWYPLIPLLLFLGLYQGNFFLILIVWFSVTGLERTYGLLSKEYYRASWWQRTLTALVYFGLIAANAWIFRTALSLEVAQGFGAPNVAEGSMNVWVAAGSTVVLSVGYTAWRLYQRRREREMARTQAAMLEQQAQVDPHKAWLRSLRIYRRLGSRYGRRWRVGYRGLRGARPVRREFLR